jgi:serine/threonine protein phosphatase PrpC
LNLSRSLGDLEYKQNKKLPPEEQMITADPEIKIENLSSDCDFLILACDGVWDCLTNQEICDIVSNRLKKEPNIKLSKIIEDILDSILATDIYNGKNI